MTKLPAFAEVPEMVGVGLLVVTELPPVIPMEVALEITSSLLVVSEALTPLRVTVATTL